MRKVLSTLIILAGIGIGLFRLFGGPGQHVALANGCKVYYKSGATEADAKAVGAALEKLGYYSDNKGDVQLTKNDNKIQLHLLVHEDATKDPKTQALLSLLGARVAALAFNGAPMQVELADAHFKTFNTLPELNLGKGVALGDNVFVFYSDSAGETEAKKLADWGSKVAKPGKILLFRLDKKADTFDVSLPMLDPGDDKNAGAEKTYADIASTLSSAVFGGAKVTVTMTTLEFKALKTVPMAVAEQPPADAPTAEAPADKTDE